MLTPCHLEVVQVEEAEPLTPAHLPSDIDLDPFMMTSAFAWQIINHSIRKAEIEKAAERMCQDYGVTRVQNVKLRMSLAQQRVRAVYFPAYLRTYVYQGRQYRLFVSGYDGDVGGDHIKSPLLIGAAAALTAAPSVFVADPMVFSPRVLLVLVSNISYLGDAV